MAAIQADETSRWSDRLLLFASISLAVAGYSVYLALPVILGSLADSLSLTERQVGWIASGEMLGIAAGSVIAARLVTSPRFRHLVLGGLALNLAVNLATAAVQDPLAIQVLRLVAGFAGGACYAWSMACLSWRGDPTRNSSLLGIAVVVMASVELQVLPAIHGLFSRQGVFVFLALLNIVPAVAFLLLRHSPTAPSLDTANDVQEEAGATQTRRSLGQIAWICLGAIAVYNVGATSFWAYIERLGVSAERSTTFVGTVLNVSNLFTLVSCYLAVLIAKRFGQFGPQVVLLASAAVLFATWPVSSGSVEFVVRTFLYFQVLMISQVYQLSALGTLDRSGRFAALLPAAQGVGQSLGPIAGSAIFALGLGFGEQLLMEGAFLAVAAAMYAVVYALVRARAPSLLRDDPQPDDGKEPIQEAA